MNIENLRKIFPQIKITDASNRTHDQIIKISQICDKVNNILVFIERNKKNQKYFIFNERYNKVRIGSYKYIIFTDQTFFVNERDDYTSYLLHLRRMINNDTQCPICFEGNLKQYFYCDQCACACCEECYDKLEDKICSMCRCDSFSGMKIE